MRFLLKLFLLVALVLTSTLHPFPSLAQGFNVASVYEVGDADAKSGDILISAGEKGLIRTDVTYDPKIFGVIDDNPLLVLRESTQSGVVKRPVVRSGDTVVNVNDFNGVIKKGNYITTSPQLGKGMQAGQSGYAVGIALEDASYTEETATVQNKTIKVGTVRVSVGPLYAELTTARSNLTLLNSLNTAFFRNIQDPEKFTQVIRFIIAGIVAVLAFGIGFFSITRSVSKAVEAIGRNPLAKQSILVSVGLQILVTVVGAIAAVAIVFIIIRF